MSGWAFLLLGLFAGVRHALEPDHLSAVGAVAAHERRPLAVLGVGLSWGAGHALAVIAAAVAFAVTGLAPPPTLVGLAEATAGAVLLLLGLRLLRRMREGGWHLHVHRHGCRLHVHVHAHPHAGAHDHAADPAHAREHAARRALLVGMLHGLAGSGPVVAALAATGGGPAALVHTAVFGAGSILGMGGLALAFGSGTARLAARRSDMLPAIQTALGAAALATGAWMVVSVLAGGAG